MFSGISPEQGPKISIPFRFYFLANLNILILLLWFIIPINYSIEFNLNYVFFNKNFLFYFHCFTIGYLLFIIFGSLFQIFPVVIGKEIQNSNTLSIFFIVLLYFILILLFFMEIKFIYSSIILVLLPFLIILIFFYFILPLLNNFRISNLGFLYAIVSLIIGIFLIFLYLFNLIKETNFSNRILELKYFHSLFMLFGFILQLMGNMLFKVIPMFYITNEYPSKIRMLFNIINFYGILLYFLINIFYKIDIIIVKSILFINNLIFIYFTFKILIERERKILDTTLYFFYFGLIIFLISNITLFFTNYIWFSFLSYFFFILSIISGMLYKIIPFLCWFHLQSLKNQIRMNINNSKSNSLPYFTFNDFNYSKIEKLHFLIFVISYGISIFLILQIKIYFFLLILLFSFFLMSFSQVLYGIVKYFNYHSKLKEIQNEICLMFQNQIHKP